MLCSSSLCLHYILDRKIHPYVFYKTGFSEDKKKKAKYFVDHTMFETNLDVLLMNDRFKDYKVNPMESIKCEKNKIEEVSKMYAYLSKNLIKSEIIEDKSFEEAYKDMIKIEKLLYSKTGVKKRIVNSLFKNTPLNTMMHPIVVKDDKVIDYLNLMKNEWKDPSSEISYNKSVNELIDEAKDDVKEWFKLVKDAYVGINVDNKLKTFTKDLIYDGYDNKKSKMKVFENVYERPKK